MKKYIYLTIFGLIALFVIYGCSLFKSYGKIRVLSRHEEKVSLQELEINYQDYTIYYAGLSVDTAVAIMFDPRFWKIVEPDEQFYGYLFCACNHGVIKSVDDTTMYVYDLESPLYTEDGPSLWEEKIFDPVR